jgi:hypothetical protein
MWKFNYVLTNSVEACHNLIIFVPKTEWVSVSYLTTNKTFFLGRKGSYLLAPLVLLSKLILMNQQQQYTSEILNT